MRVEHWKEIEGFPDYMVSDLGRVKSLKFNREKILKQSMSYTGYLCVNLCNKGEVSTKRINRLVAEAFLENPDNKPEINHKNDDKTDNWLENLEWSNTLREYKPCFWHEDWKSNQARFANVTGITP